MNTSDILSIIAIGISLISIVWSAISYFKYDRKLKALEIEEKEIGIQKHKQEKEDEKKAVIKGGFIYQGEGKYCHQCGQMYGKKCYYKSSRRTHYSHIFHSNNRLPVN